MAFVLLCFSQPMDGCQINECVAINPDMTVEEVVDLIPGNQFDAFDRFLDQIPFSHRFSVMQQIRAQAFKKYNKDVALIICRHAAHHPFFEGFLEKLPFHWEQGIFYAQLPFLKTRICLSLFDDPKLERDRVDYSFRVIDQTGRQRLSGKKTIHVNQTHTFELDDLLRGSDPGFGMFWLDTVEMHLHSLRFYAYWYNENSMTTTHEKKALGNRMPLLSYPVILSQSDYETFVAVCNNSREESLVLEMNLSGQAGKPHPETRTITLPPLCSLFTPVSSLFTEVGSFLKGMSGALHVSPSQRNGMYYYFTQNKRWNSWQAQHL